MTWRRQFACTCRALSEVPGTLESFVPFVSFVAGHYRQERSWAPNARASLRSPKRCATKCWSTTGSTPEERSLSDDCLPAPAATRSAGDRAHPKGFARLATERGFLHVPIAPHHSQTNGIVAERFVRTLKEWLEKRSRNSPDEPAALLAEFISKIRRSPARESNEPAEQGS